ncbi:hypothetical protein MKW98_022917 [Papaver atlanticum]|uniref:Uncharacterized protein n=1 Tax=Papaver atlanticum TaxID=357466 RepID=A0AAD4TM86_9MAGN|nr:hypothetical protein MKW98_022917 [Papaver atlanticum]
MANTGWAVLLNLALLVKPYMSGIPSSLEELFSTCGKILWMDIPTFPYTNVTLGLVDFLSFLSFSVCIPYKDFRLQSVP